MLKIWINKHKKKNVMRMKLIVFGLLFMSMILSCKKEEIGTVGNGGNPAGSYVALLSKVLVDNQSAYEYIYNDSNLVVQEKSKFDYSLNHYNSKGQLATTEFYGNDAILSTDVQVSQAAINSNILVTPSTGIKGGLMTYIYNSNSQLIKTVYTRPSSTGTESSEFTYGSNNKISKQTMYWETTVTGYIDYLYDNNGNLTKESLYNMPASGVAEMITNTQYTFDNQSNPFKSTSKLQIPGINTNQNNIVKEVYTVHLSAGQGPDNVQTTETTYGYNAMGYPVTKNGNTTYVYK
jgi:hypothetical protein